jgi:hypothetical protein
VGTPNLDLVLLVGWVGGGRKQNSDNNDYDTTKMTIIKNNNESGTSRGMPLALMGAGNVKKCSVCCSLFKEVSNRNRVL